MSIKEQYEFFTHEVTERVVTDRTMYCDVCGKEIAKNASYWEVSTGHYDCYDGCYDNDDGCFDVCSDMCLTAKFFEYTDKSSKSNYDTEYFEVETKVNRC